MKIFAIGKNYAEHNKELDGSLLKPEKPVVFMMPDTALLTRHRPFFLPDDMGRIDYEAEIVVRICRLGKGIPQRFAHRYYDAVTVGIDFTARDVQRELRAKGLPWEMSKCFDGAAAVGEWVDMAEAGDIDWLTFRLDINGETVQQGCTAEMYYGVDELIAYISRYITLRQGDLLFTGTPVGVGPVHIDDHLEGYLNQQKVLEFNVK